MRYITTLLLVCVSRRIVGDVNIASVQRSVVAVLLGANVLVLSVVKSYISSHLISNVLTSFLVGGVFSSILRFVMWKCTEKMQSVKMSRVFYLTSREQVHGSFSSSSSNAHQHPRQCVYLLKGQFFAWRTCCGVRVSCGCGSNTRRTVSQYIHYNSFINELCESVCLGVGPPIFKQGVCER